MEYDFLKILFGFGVIAITAIAFYVLIVFIMDEFVKARKEFEDIKIRMLLLESKLKQIVK